MVFGYFLMICSFADADDSEEPAVFLFMAVRDERRHLLPNPATYQINNIISHSHRIIMHIKYYEGTHDCLVTIPTRLRRGRPRIRGLVPSRARYLISHSAA